MSNIKLLKGDSRDILKTLQDNSVDSVVCDPPYAIGFMGKGWDSGDANVANDPTFWKEVLRVLKPGGHLLSFSHSRTYHRQAVAVEDAGFEIRDQLLWVYGSGFPKSHNIGKSVDKIEGNEREVVSVSSITGNRENKGNEKYGNGDGIPANINYNTKGNTPYEGWGTALKPAHEPIVMGRKPFKGTVAQNVLEWGTGGINIDGCRVGNQTITSIPGMKSGNFQAVDSKNQKKQELTHTYEGRFPANIIFDEEAGKILDEQSGVSKSSKRGAHNNKKTEHTNTYTPPQAMYSDENTYGDSGGASRFFYCPKSSKKDRNEGVEHLEVKRPDTRTDTGMGSFTEKGVQPQHNSHPTVKPTDLMAYLVRLVTPKGGTVLDPFMGSGSTGKAAVREGMNFIGIEREDEYMEISKSRIEHEQSKHKHREFFDAV